MKVHHYIKFQFYISAIITKARADLDKTDVAVSILHKCDYNEFVIYE